ncbi:MAG: N-acetyltransferase family protein [Vampirovibrionales bacterium]
MVGLQCRHATPEDDEFIRKLRNQLKASFVHQEDITPEQQTAYMATHRASYWVCWMDRIPVGFIGIVAHDLRLAVSPDHQRMGVAAHMLQEVLPLFPEAEVKVKPENLASLAFFQRQGFQPCGTDDRGLIKMQRPL